MSSIDPMPLGELRSLSDAALLGALLRPPGGGGGGGGGGGADAGGAGAEAVAAHLLAEIGGLARLARHTAFELEPMEGVGEWSALRIAAALELGRRVALHASEERPRLTDSAAVFRFARPLVGDLVHEELWVLAVDAQQRLRASGCIARGGLHGLHVAVRDPLRFALRHGASAILVVHNHPSGDPTPSVEDLTFTDRLAAAADTVGTPMLDHVIVAGARYRSLLDDGLLSERKRDPPADAVRSGPRRAAQPRKRPS
ncbi:hypothetical protein BH09MYX1_BH09MYX1_60000 [soil metagenome]